MFRLKNVASRQKRINRKTLLRMQKNSLARRGEKMKKSRSKLLPRRRYD